MNVISDYILCKDTASAFSNSELQKILTENNISEIEIAGIDGNFCVKYTAIDSVLNGYKTRIIIECIGTQNKKRFEKTKLLLSDKGIIIE